MQQLSANDIILFHKLFPSSSLSHETGVIKHSITGCPKNQDSIILCVVQGRKIINPSGGYPPDLLRFVANERRDPVDIHRRDL